MRIPVPTLLLTIAMSLGLAACANGPDLRDAQRLALYEANAGAPVESFHYFGGINGWTPLGDSALAVWTRPNQGYLLDLLGSCPDLEYARAISVSNQFGRVHARFDSVDVLDRDSFGIPCRIEQIRPIDAAALKQAEREMRESVEMAERTQDAGGGT
ncbi:DUF6491 family protein [Lysobacter sp. D1-1-M9]|uniref:DUF6491 family protein n=2 Tax=Novilysobacter TaxID=3382699 RepID=UPI002FC5FC93